MGTLDLAEALFGKTRRLVLGLFFSHPDESFYLRQLAQVLGLGHGALQRELRRLVAAGILLRQAQGSQVHYQANRDCPIYADLYALILKTVGLVDGLRVALAPLAQRIELAFVFGSLAKGSATVDSDVDVMVIGAVSFGEVVAALAPTQDVLGREVNPSVYSANEVRAQVWAGAHFLSTVLREPKLYVVGGEDELERLVEAGVGDAASPQPSGDR